VLYLRKEPLVSPTGEQWSDLPERKITYSIGEKIGGKVGCVGRTLKGLFYQEKQREGMLKILLDQRLQ